MELPIAETEQTEPKKKATLWKGAGIIVVDKTQGPSSHEIAAWVGQMLGCEVGHSGTLDPQVSGLLLIMLGNAVRLAPLLLAHDKEYICLMRLHSDVDPESIQKMGEEFTGRLYQRPPRKSAVKRNLRIRTIHKLEILSIDGRLVLFRVNCEAGTYIRSLCHHMGFALGVGGHMAELRRSRSGSFDESSMHTLHELKDACVAAEAGDRTALESMVMSVDAAVPDLPVVTVRDTAIDAVCRGAVLAGVGVISCDEFGKNQTVAVLSEKREFVCLGKALVPSTSFKPGETGLVIAPTAVFMKPGTYSRGWTKSDKPVSHEKKPAKKPVAKPARRPSPQFQRKRYH